MAIDRNLAQELSANGLLLEGGSHFSSGSGTPTHSGLVGDWYFKTSDATLWRLKANGTSWGLITASEIAFDITGIPFTQTNVQDAVANLRSRVTNTPTVVTTSAGGTTTLTASSTSLQLVEGTAVGHSFVLPDATTLFVGTKFEIQNASSQSLTLKNNSGSSIATIIAGDSALITLKTNATANGVWTVVAVTSVAAGVNAFNVVASSTFSTSSTTDTILTGITYTPPSGTYGVWFSADLNVGTNNARVQCVIFKAGSVVSDTRRNTQGAGSNFKTNMQTLGIVQVDGSQAIDVRVNVSSGTIDIAGRSFLLIRLGA